jgi:hypothetical protein
MLQVRLRSMKAEIETEITSPLCVSCREDIAVRNSDGERNAVTVSAVEDVCFY